MKPGDGTPGPGRPKGLQNKSTRLAKEAIAFAADKLGGAERLAAWAAESAENEKAFWATIYPKLLPLQVTGEDGEAIRVQMIERRIVRPRADERPDNPNG